MSREFPGPLEMTTTDLHGVEAAGGKLDHATSNVRRRRLDNESVVGIVEGVPSAARRGRDDRNPAHQVLGESEAPALLLRQDQADLRLVDNAAHLCRGYVGDVGCVRDCFQIDATRGKRSTGHNRKARDLGCQPRALVDRRLGHHHRPVLLGQPKRLKQPLVKPAVVVDPGSAKTGLLRCRNLVGRVAKHPDAARQRPLTAAEWCFRFGGVGQPVISF